MQLDPDSHKRLQFHQATRGAIGQTIGAMRPVWAWVPLLGWIDPDQGANCVTWLVLFAVWPAAAITVAVIWGIFSLIRLGDAGAPTLRAWPQDEPVRRQGRWSGRRGFWTKERRLPARLKRGLKLVGQLGLLAVLGLLIALALRRKL